MKLGAKMTKPQCISMHNAEWPFKALAYTWKQKHEVYEMPRFQKISSIIIYNKH